VVGGAPGSLVGMSVVVLSIGEAPVPTGHPPVEGSWSAGQGPVARRLAVPLREFLDTEVAGGLVLLAATIGAMLLYGALAAPARPESIPEEGGA
jgi:hypothetical protein